MSWKLSGGYWGKKPADFDGRGDLVWVDSRYSSEGLGGEVRSCHNWYSAENIR